ncbi:microtubule-associated protein futsch-like isoform X3 [Aphis gossypii]|uniref:microtubule-associated protein futsch-like isoform X3 n=1 Tax=Aphis gossypii TaxID=80765 RepID=UPI00215961F6|nr:microtubule-associated protein futsch-like isoform X3 [Aphis gossypii]
MGNPSDHVETPLTGGYLLIVLAEPRTAEHKLAILKKLTKGLSCWNYEESGVEIVTELNAIVNQNIEGEEGKNGEQLFQYVSDNLVAEILINPQHSTLVQCVRNLLASFTKYRCIIHAGYSFTENGSWIVQDGSFSVIDFLDAYKTAEAQRTIRLHENHIRIDLHCSADADWNQVSRLKGTRFLLNPPEKIVDNESIESTVRWLCDKIEVVELDILLEGSQVVGNIRFSRPTLYVFPAGQGDSALFGINGFNMLIDGGAGRNSCFWGFARHLDRLDAVLLTRLNSSNLEGVASFLKRKTMSSLYPQIGHFFCNFKTRKQISSPNTDAKQDVLSISLIDTAQSIITDLKQLQLRPHLCYRNINLEPINLYHKVGHGKLDMYVLNPSKDSKEVKDFLTKWNEGDQKLFNPTKDLQFPLPNIISVCTLLVWQPANPNTTITRIFFPGSSPQNKIFESLERVRHLEFLKHPSCSIKSMSSSTSVTIKSQTTKKTVLEKMIPGETKAVKTMENLEVSTSASNAVIQTAIIPTVPKEGTPKPKFPVEAEKSKPNLKTVTKETVNSKTKIEHKYSSISAKVNSNKVIQKSTTIKKTLKLSSKSPPTDKSTPTTPIENQEKTPKPIKQVIKPKSTIKSPSSTPTKSKKEEANRKVLVSSRTNSGLKRTQITKKEIKPAKPINEIETEGISSKKDSNIIYKSSLISGDKDKSGEEEDILIVEKVAITPEKLLTPDGKKIIANELDGILTTAKDIVIKEKCVEKLSDSGATTAPTMPEDEKINDSKKEIEVNESDQKSEEFKKAKDALKTPDEVADLPFHEEADEHKTKVTEKVIETEIESQEIVQVENAEYVLVSLDSSPEALKRQVLDNVNLLDTELDEESEKEDEYVEKKESKLIEHLLESSKDLCEITDKIDELKKQNEHEINNHLIHENLQNYSHGNTETINVCAELINQEKQIEIQEKAKSRGSLSDETLQTMVNETITTATNVINRSGSTTEEQERVSEHIRATHESKVSTKPDSIDNEQVQSSLNDTNTSSSKITSRSGSISIDKKANTTEKTTDKQDSKASSNAGSVCEEPVKSPVNETVTSSSKVASRSGSITDDQAKTTEISEDKKDSKASSKEASVCDEPVKSPVNETITSSSKVASRSASITNEQEKTTGNVNDNQDSKASSRAGSVCDEHVKSPVHETFTSSSKVASRSGSIITEEQEKTTDKQDSKASSKAGSVCDEPVKSPVHETILTANKVPSRSGSITTDEQEKTLDKLESKTSSKSGSVCDEPVKSPVHETILTANKVSSRSGSITTDEQEKSLDKLESKASSKAGSVCDEPVKSPIHETNTSSSKVASRSASITNEQEKTTGNVNDNQNSKASSRAGSVCDEHVKSPVHETFTSSSKVASRSGSIITEEQEKTTDKQDSKASSKAGSVCDEPVKSPVHETILTADKVTSRSGSITTEEQEKTLDKLESKTSSKSGSVCDEPVKSPVHETILTANKVPSRSGSITTDEQEKTLDKLESKASSKAGSVCDEPVKSPVHETILTANIVTSRSGSITNEQEKTTENVNENQGSKESSRAGSVCDEHVKSPVHETITSSSKVASRSASITTEEQEKTLDKLESKASSKAGSVCDEPVKSPVHETILTADKVASRSGSITTDEQEKTLDKLESKASSKAGSVCDEQVKSPVHETITSSSKVASRSGSITTDEQEITTDKIDSKASSKAGSVCDEPVKSPVHETILTADKVASRSGSITTDEQEKTLDKLESKASSKSSSVCDEPVKSPIRETITSSSKVASRSGSITNEQEKTTENVNDNQDSKVSSRAGSVCDKHVKSPVYETITSSSKVASRSGSITTDEQEITTDIMDSKASSKAGSVCDELVESLLCEATASDKIKTMISSSISHEPLHDNQYSKVSRKASSICEEPLKSSELEINTDVTKLKSRPSSINQDQDIVYNSLTDKQEFNASSNETSSINYREPIKIDCFEKNTNERVISSRPNSEEELLDSVPSINKYSTLENTISDISFKEQEIVSTSLINKSNSICQDTESTPTLAMDKYDIETSSRKDSFCQDKNESITISSSSTSSICQEINTQSSKLSSRKSSIIDDLIDKPSKLQIGEKSSSLQESNIYDHSIDDNSKIFNKSGSLCDEMLNMSFNKVTENVISNKTCERIVSPTLIAENTECKIDNKEGSVGEESMKSSNNETGNKGNLISSTLNSIPQKTEEEKNQSSKSSSIFDETQKLQIENNKIILSPFEIIETNVIEKKVEESKSLGRIGSLCEEIAKFLTDDDKKMSTNNTYESSCGINESTLKNNNEVLKVETEPLLQFEKNTYALNKIEKPLQLDDEVKVSEKHDNINEKNTDHSLPAENITVSNIKSSDISTILIEENNKTGIMNVAQMVGKNINDESFTKHTAITDNESKNLKTVNPISSITSEECISKLSNVLIEDIVKSSNEKNIMNNSSLTDICVNQPLGVTLNSEDLGVTKDIVMQLKRDVHEALHQCSSDDERPYTPQSESSMSRSAMNIDEDDDDNEDNKIETDDDMAGSPMSTGPSPIQMQLDNRQVEINIDFNKAIQEHRITRGEDLTTTEANGNHVTEIKTTEHDNINQNQSTSSDTVQSWGKPLGLPPVQSINNNGFDPIREWGKPFGLPSPTQPVLELGETQNMSSKITPKKLKKIMDNKPIINVMDKDSQNRIRRSESPSKLRSRSSSRMSRINPVYLDLIYVPHHGNSKYVSADFFKRVRARNYVFSGTDPSKEVLNALIEGKQAWEDQDLEVTIIPTYDTDTLGQWVAENEELLTKLKIDLSPSASRCTIKLQDHNTSCSAYRLEF